MKKAVDEVNDDGMLGQRMAVENGAIDKVGSSLYEPRRYQLNTVENCRELLSDVLFSVTAGEMDISLGKFAADVAKKAADTLIKEERAESRVADILREIAEAQPGLKGSESPVREPDHPGVEIVLSGGSVETVGRK